MADKRNLDMEEVLTSCISGDVCTNASILRRRNFGL